LLAITSQTARNHLAAGDEYPDLNRQRHRQMIEEKQLYETEQKHFFPEPKLLIYMGFSIFISKKKNFSKPLTKLNRVG